MSSSQSGCISVVGTFNLLRAGADCILHKEAVEGLLMVSDCPLTPCSLRTMERGGGMIIQNMMMQTHALSDSVHGKKGGNHALDKLFSNLHCSMLWLHDQSLEFV